MTTTSISVQAVQDHPLPEQAPGTVVGGRFEVLSKLGEGMLGAVYCVRNTKTGEKFALKLMRPKLVADDLDVNHFNHEIQLAKQFDHPCIARVFDSGEHEGTLYYTMELVEGGESLRHLIDRYKSRGEDIPIEEVHDIVDGVLEGLIHAHDARQALRRLAVVSPEGIRHATRISCRVPNSDSTASWRAGFYPRPRRLS